MSDACGANQQNRTGRQARIEPGAGPSAASGPGSGSMSARGSLWSRIALLGVAIAVVTGVLAGVLAIGLIRSADDRTARRALSRIADAAQSAAVPTAALDRVRLKRRVLAAIGIRYGELTPAGQVITAAPIVRRALTVDDRRRLLAGVAVSTTRTV